MSNLISDKQISFIQAMNKVCSEKFDYVKHPYSKQASKYIKAHLAEYNAKKCPNKAPEKKAVKETKPVTPVKHRASIFRQPVDDEAWMFKGFKEENKNA